MKLLIGLLALTSLSHSTTVFAKGKIEATLVYFELANNRLTSLGECSGAAPFEVVDTTVLESKNSLPELVFENCAIQNRDKTFNLSLWAGAGLVKDELSSSKEISKIHQMVVLVNDRAITTWAKTSKTSDTEFEFTSDIGMPNPNSQNDSQGWLRIRVKFLSDEQDHGS